VLRGDPCEIGDNFISRIHVDDLAAHVEAALLSDLTGAYPVADEDPCTSREIVEFCAASLGLRVPQAKASDSKTNRRVDGSAIRRLLGISLQYPSYRKGIPQALRSLHNC
jgi:nucleoside-diphosphate-sugar epimerase